MRYSYTFLLLTMLLGTSGITLAAPVEVFLLGTGDGQVKSQPKGINCSNAKDALCTTEYPSDTKVVLVATPDDQSTFSGWSGLGDLEQACQGQQASVTITINAASKVNICSAKFEPKEKVKVDLPNSSDKVVVPNSSDKVGVPNSSDDDNISAEIENAAPNQGDGNDDGTPDSTQSNVISLPRQEGGAYLTLVANSSCTFQNVFTGLETDILQADAQFNFPLGLVSFELVNCDKTDVKMYYHGKSDLTGATYRHYDNNKGQQRWESVPTPKFERAMIGGKPVATVTVSLQDEEGAGKIVELGGVGLPDPDYVDDTQVSPSALAKRIQFFQPTLTVNMTDELGTVSTTLPSGNQATGKLVMLQVNRLDNLNGQITVKVQPPGKQVGKGTKVQEGKDYVLFSPTLTWADGDGQPKTVQLFLPRDCQTAEKTFSLALTNPGGEAESGDPEVQVRVTDQAGPAVTLRTDDQEPLVLWMSGGQGECKITQGPNPEWVNLEVNFPQKGGAVISLKGRRTGGPTQLLMQNCGTNEIVRNCGNNEGVVNLKVEAPSKVETPPIATTSCTPLQTVSKEVTLVDGGEALTLLFTGNTDNLQVLPSVDTSIVTLDNFEPLAKSGAKVTLVPRGPGQTTLTLDNCSNAPVTVNIKVLKRGTLGYYCWLDKNTGGICQSKNPALVIRSNAETFINSEWIAAPSYFDIHFEGRTELSFTATDTARLDVTTIAEDLKDQAVEVLVAVYGGEDKSGFMHNGLTLSPKVAEPTAPESLVKNNQPVNDWQPWDVDKLDDLVATAEIDLLPVVNEFSLTMNFQGLPAGQYILYVGYRLSDGTIVSNLSPIKFGVAKSSALP
jgi:hypothetical protein